MSFPKAFKLAETATDIEAWCLMTLNAARLKAEGQACIKEVSMAKLFASEMAERVGSALIQIHGEYAYLSDLLAERLHRDARIVQIYEGSNVVQKLVIARALPEEN